MKNQKVTALFGVALLFAIGVGAVVFLPKNSSKRVTQAPLIESPVAPMVVPPPRIVHKPGEKPVVTIYEVATNEDGSHLEPRAIPLPAIATTPAAQLTAAFAAMEKLSPRLDPLPRGVKVLSVTFGENGTATVDFNRALQTNFVPGDQNEALAVNTILATTGQFPGVEKVQITIEGAKISSLGGMESLNKPLPIPQDVAKNTLEKAH